MNDMRMLWFWTTRRIIQRKAGKKSEKRGGPVSLYPNKVGDNKVVIVHLEPHLQ